MAKTPEIGNVFGTLNSIERFHYFDSSSRFPNRIIGRLLVHQQIDLELCRKAFFSVAERHPILSCSIEKIGRRLCWVHFPQRFRFQPNSSLKELEELGQHSHSFWLDGESTGGIWFFLQELDSAPDQPPDFTPFLLKAGHFNPFMLIRQWPDHQRCDRTEVESEKDSCDSSRITEIWLSTHHAFCDGGGGIAIANDWIRIYDNLRRHRQPTDGLMGMDHQRFAARNHLGLLTWRFLRKIPFQPVGLFGATKFIFRKTATLDRINEGSQTAIQRSAEAPIGIASRWLQSDDLRRLEILADRENYNVNARMIADFLAALEKWRLKWVTAASADQWQRIILPINIRQIGDRKLPAANRTSIVQIDRRRIDTQSPKSLIRSIQREVGVIIQWKLDRMFLIFIKLIGLSTALLRHVAENKKHRGIAVFTNLGHPFRRLEKSLKLLDDEPDLASQQRPAFDPIEIDFLAPLRHGTALNLTVAKFKSRLRITLHFDPTIVTSQQAEELVENFLDNLRSTPVEDSKY